jgi:DNA-binding NarL/FixJ family response regulator
MSVEPIRVLIADDHRLFREALRSVLERERECEVVGEAASGEEALALTLRTRPQVVLLDVGMPGMAASTLHTAWPRKRRPQESSFSHSMMTKSTSLKRWLTRAQRVTW